MGRIVSARRVIYDSDDEGLSFPVATITTGSFTGTLNHLQIFALLRSNDAAAAVNGTININGKEVKRPRANAELPFQNEERIILPIQL